MNAWEIAGIAVPAAISWLTAGWFTARMRLAHWSYVWDKDSGYMFSHVRQTELRTKVAIAIVAGPIAALVCCVIEGTKSLTDGTIDRYDPVAIRRRAKEEADTAKKTAAEAIKREHKLESENERLRQELLDMGIET